MIDLWLTPSNNFCSEVVRRTKLLFDVCMFVCLMVFNATFNNISAISWRSVLLVEETGVPRENHGLSQVTDKLYHIMLCTPPWSRFELTTSVVIDTNCIASCKSNYHTEKSLKIQETREVMISCNKRLEIQKGQSEAVS